MPEKLDSLQRGQAQSGFQSEQGHSLSLGAGWRLATVALKADWMAKRGRMLQKGSEFEQHATHAKTGATLYPAGNCVKPYAINAYKYN